MGDLITSQMLSDWRANYGLDKRTPIKAMHWWQDNMDGKAPAGVVAALGLCINEIERLTAERDDHARWRAYLADKLHDRETTISAAWEALRSAGVHSEATIDDGICLLRRQLAEAEQDARRYRDWLRGGANIPSESTRWARWEVRHWDGRCWNTLFAEQMDAAIDAAMGASNEQSEHHG